MACQCRRHRWSQGRGWYSVAGVIGAWGTEGVAMGGGSLTLLSVPRATEALMGSQDPRVTRARKGSE